LEEEEDTLAVVLRRRSERLFSSKWLILSQEREAIKTPKEGVVVLFIGIAEIKSWWWQAGVELRESILVEALVEVFKEPQEVTFFSNFYYFLKFSEKKTARVVNSNLTISQVLVPEVLERGVLLREGAPKMLAGPVGQPLITQDTILREPPD
jgi:hypothetical protein